MNQILKPSVDKNDYIECEYCKNKLYRKTIEWQLYGDKKVLTLDYERCNCKEAEVYWNEYDLKKLKMLEEERKLELMQEFAQKVEKIIKNSNDISSNIERIKLARDILNMKEINEKVCAMLIKKIEFDSNKTITITFSFGNSIVIENKGGETNG